MNEETARAVRAAERALLRAHVTVAETAFAALKSKQPIGGILDDGGGAIQAATDHLRQVRQWAEQKERDSDGD